MNETEATDMPEPFAQGAKFVVGDWLADPSALRIEREGEVRRLEPKVMALLVCLAVAPGRTRTREELERRIWPDVIVGYDALAGAVSKLRAALDDDPTAPVFIETIPKTGYRLVAPVDAAARGRPPEARPPRRRVVIWASIGMAAALFAVGYALFSGWIPGLSREFGIRGKPTIAVLPLENYTGDPAQTLWSDALAEEVIADLSRFSDFFVVAKTSSFSYRDQPKDIREIGRELLVRYVLEGGLRRSGDGFELSARLVETDSGAHVWAKTFTAPGGGLHQLPAEVTEEIVSTLGGRIDAHELQSMSAGDIANMEAYQLVQKGRAEWLKWTPEANAAAERLYSRAIARDPDYASAYRSLAWVHINEHRYGWNQPRDSALAAAQVAAARAMSLAPFDYRIHWTRATVRMRAGDLEAALQDFEKALELNPNAADVMADMSVPLVYAGRPDEAVKRLEQAISRNPLHPYWYDWNLAWALYFAGDPEAALAAFLRMSYVPARALLVRAAINQRLGRVADARADVAAFLDTAPGHNLEAEAETLSPMREDALRARWLGDLRAAGLPD